MMRPLPTFRRAVWVTFFLAAMVSTISCGGTEANTPEELRESIEAGRVDEAIPVLEELLDESPDDPELNHLYGLALMASQRFAVAIWPLRKAVEQEPDRLEARLLLAQAHLEGGSPSDAVRVADALLAQHPDLLEAYLVRIQANKHQNKPEEALADVDAILGYRPDDLSALASRAGLLLELERGDEAAEAIEALRAQVETAEAPEQWKARLCATDATFRFERDGLDALEEVEEMWTACLEAHPTDAIVVQGVVGFYEQRGEPDRALEVLEQAAERAPENIDFRVALAVRHNARGDHEKAEQALLEVADEPRSAAWPILIEHYSERKEYEKAIAAIEKWMEAIGSPPPSVKLQYADLLIRGGAFEKAEGAIAEIEAPELRNLLEGRLALDRGEPERALPLIEKGIQLWPNNSVARMLAAEAAMALGDVDRAYAEYVEAVRNDPVNFEAITELAAIARPLRRAEPIGQYVIRYASKEPGNPEGHRLLAEIGMWSGRPEMTRGAIASLATMPGQGAQAVALGAKLRAMANLKQAVDFLEGVPLDLTDPASLEPLEVLVELLGDLGRHEEAIARLDAAIAAHGDVAAFQELRARALRASGAPADDIRASAERALALESERPGAMRVLAAVEAEAGDVDTAVDLCDRAAELADTDPAPLWEAVQILDAAGRDTEVDARLEGLVAKFGEHAGANRRLAKRLLERGGDAERAVRLATLAVRLGGGPHAQATLGEAALRADDPELAVRALRGSLEARPDAPSTRYHLGVALARAGDEEAARTELLKALESSGFPEESDARAELARLGS